MADTRFTEINNMVRLFLRDRAEFNLLLDDVQFSTQDIENAVRLTLSELNVMPPVTSFTIDDTPEYLLVLGTARYLAYSEAFLQVRNQVSFQSDDNEAVGIDDKYALYMQLQNDLRAEWKEAARRFKDNKNAESGYGSMSSGYANVTRYNS